MPTTATGEDGRAPHWRPPTERTEDERAQYEPPALTRYGDVGELTAASVAFVSGDPGSM